MNTRISQIEEIFTSMEVNVGNSITKSMKELLMKFSNTIPINRAKTGGKND